MKWFLRKGKNWLLTNYKGEKMSVGWVVAGALPIIILIGAIFS